MKMASSYANWDWISDFHQHLHNIRWMYYLIFILLAIVITILELKSIHPRITKETTYRNNALIKSSNNTREISTTLDVFPFTGIITLVIGVVFGVVFVCHYKRSRLVLALSIILILGSLIYPVYSIMENIIKLKCIGCLANYFLDVAIVLEIIAGILLLAAFEGPDKRKHEIRNSPQLRLNLDEKMLIA